MLTLFLSLFGLIHSAWSTVPLPPEALNYKIEASFSYFSSKDNLDGGELVGLPNGGEFTTVQSRFLYHQDYQEQWRFYGGLSYGWSESWDGTNSRTNSGVNEILAGGQYWLPLQDFRLVPQLDFVYPLWRADLNTDDVMIGEGAMRIRGGGWFLYPVNSFTPFVYLGYEFRDEGRSHLLPYAAGVKFASEMGFWLQGEYRGFESIIDDDDTNDGATRLLMLDRVNGGSRHFYSINPSVGEIALSGGLQFGEFEVSATAAMTIAGSNSADGWTALVRLSYSPVTATTSSDQFDASPIEEFNESGAVEVPPEREQPKVRMIPKKRSRPTRQRPTSRPATDVDLLLQETQRELENME